MLPSGVLVQQDHGKSVQKREICPFESWFQNLFCVFAVTLNRLALDEAPCCGLPGLTQWPLDTSQVRSLLRSPLRFQFTQSEPVPSSRSVLSFPSPALLSHDIGSSPSDGAEVA